MERRQSTTAPGSDLTDVHGDMKAVHDVSEVSGEKEPIKTVNESGSTPTITVADSTGRLGRTSSEQQSSSLGSATRLQEPPLQHIFQGLPYGWVHPADCSTMQLLRLVVPPPPVHTALKRHPRSAFTPPKTARKGNAVNLTVSSPQVGLKRQTQQDREEMEPPATMRRVMAPVAAGTPLSDLLNAAFPPSPSSSATREMGSLSRDVRGAQLAQNPGPQVFGNLPTSGNDAPNPDESNQRDFFKNFTLTYN